MIESAHIKKKKVITWVGWHSFPAISHVWCAFRQC